MSGSGFEFLLTFGGKFESYRGVAVFVVTRSGFLDIFTRKPDRTGRISEFEFTLTSDVFKNVFGIFNFGNFYSYRSRILFFDRRFGKTVIAQSFADSIHNAAHFAVRNVSLTVRFQYGVVSAGEVYTFAYRAENRLIVFNAVRNRSRNETRKAEEPDD